MPSWQLTVSMHQIGSLVCNIHDKLMVKMTILFLLCTHHQTVSVMTLYYVCDLCGDIVYGEFFGEPNSSLHGVREAEQPLVSVAAFFFFFLK